MSLEQVSTPRWLAPLTQVLCETQPAALAERWCEQISGHLRRLDGQVPFRLVHQWQADAVLPLLCDAFPDHRQALFGLQSLHQRAALGVPGRKGEWRAALRPVLQSLYRRAYAYDEAYAQAHDSAMTFGLAPANTAMIAEHFGDAEAFALYYAQLSTDANAAAFARANAVANTEIAAGVYASQDAEAYAGICGASARVYAWACASGVEQRRSVFNRLAEGLNQCLAQLQPLSTGEQHE